MRPPNKHPSTKQHNYLAKIAAMQRNGMFPQATLSDVFIKHDDWCDVHRGGFCNCDPDIELKPIP